MAMIGVSRFAERLGKLASNSAMMGPAVFAAASAIKTTARHSITQGHVSGKNHVPSRPGDPPNRDTGHLDTNIEAFKTGPLTVQVKSQASYAAFLEYGTAKMAERPYMRPAVKANETKIKELMTVTVRRIVESS